MAEDPLGVVISAREIYNEILGAREDVRNLVQSNKEVDKTLSDHEARLRSVERWKYSLPVAAVIGVVTAVYSAK